MRYKAITERGGYFSEFRHSISRILKALKTHSLYMVPDPLLRKLSCPFSTDSDADAISAHRVVVSEVGKHGVSHMANSRGRGRPFENCSTIWKGGAECSTFDVFRAERGGISADERDGISVEERGNPFLGI